MTQPEEARDIKFKFIFISAMVQLSTIKVSFINKPLFTSYTTLLLIMIPEGIPLLMGHYTYSI